MTRAGPAALLLVAAVLVVYLPALGSSFQFDDWNVIVRDPRVQSLAAWAASMPGIRPLLKLSYALNHQLGGGAAAFRACNIVVHGLNAVLVFGLLRTMGARLGLDARRAMFAAATAAAVFALHPAQTEAVTYVSGRSTSLSTLFALSAFAAWLRGLDTAEEGRWRWLSFGAFVLALGVKEAPIAVPFAMAAWLVATRSAASIPRRIAPHALLLLGGVALVLAWPPYRAVLTGSLGARPIGANLLTQVDAITYLLGQLVRLGGMNADPGLPTVMTADAGILGRAALLLALAALGLALLWRRPAVGFAITWFFLWLLPTNSLIPRLDVVNDRQLYVALIGPAWLLGLALARWNAATSAAAGGPAGSIRRSMPVGIAAALVLALALALASLRHNRVYATEIAFWEDVTRQSPSNARAANNLGYAYALACRDAAARREFTRSIALDPQDYRAPSNLRLLSEGALFADNERTCARSPDDAIP